jgi:4-amino-4-deoxy-L-arabinose transferase
VALLVLFAFAGQGERALWEPDEGRYACVALQMLRLGDWDTPMLNHEVPHFSKPPLTYWLLASSFDLFGSNELAARTPNTLAFIATALLLVWLGRFLAPSSRLLPAIVYATSIFPFVAANIITTDTLLTLWETLAVAGFVRLWMERRDDGALLMWLGFGLAFLTKGPPGLLPLLAILTFAVVHRAVSPRKLFPAEGLLVFFVVAGGWYAQQIYMRPDLLHYLVGTELVARATSASLHRNSGAFDWLIYVGVALVAMLPWAPLALRRVRREGIRPSTDVSWFLAGWLLIPLAVFVVTPSRLPLYVLPLVVPAALLIGRTLPDGILATPRRRAALALWIVLLVAVRYAGAHYSPEDDSRSMARWIRGATRQAPKEVIFVNMRPAYGLTMYLGAEVEGAALPGWHDDVPRYRPVYESLAHEMSEPDQSRRIYVLPARRIQEFERAIHGAGLEPVVLGSHEELLFVDARRREKQVKGQRS